MKQIERVLMGAALVALCVGFSSCSDAFHDAMGMSGKGGLSAARDDLYLGQEPVSVAVESIDGVPDAAYAGTDRPLNGTVKPDTATHTNIIWSVAADNAGTGVIVEDGVLTTGSLTGTEEGISYPVTVTVRATVPNGQAPGLAYTQDFKITVYGKPQYGIQLSPTSTTFTAQVGYGTIEKSITITNIGDQATGSLTLTLAGDDSASFILTESISGTSIAPEDSGTFTIKPIDGLAAKEYTATVTVANSGNGISANCTVSFTVTKPALVVDSGFERIRPYGTADGPAFAIEMKVYSSPTNPVYKVYYKAGDHSAPGSISGFSDGWTAVSGGAATVVAPQTTGVVTIPAGNLTGGQSYTGVAVLTSDSHQDYIISSPVQKFTHSAAAAVLDLSSPGPGEGTISPSWYYSGNIYYIGTDVTVTGTSGNDRRLVVPAGVQGITVTLDNATIAVISENRTYPTPLTLGAGAKITLNLVGTSALTGRAEYGTAAIEVPDTAELTITGSGQLTASAGAGGSGPGIGGRQNQSNCGTVIINSGTVIARGGYDPWGYGGGAGIGGAGGSANDNGGTVIINGGQVTATGGTGAAGIGGGGGISHYWGNGGTVTITGGQVTASGARAFGGASGSSNHGTQTVSPGYSWQYSENSNGDDPLNGEANNYNFNADHKWVRIQY